MNFYYPLSGLCQPLWSVHVYIMCCRNVASVIALSRFGPYNIFIFIAFINTLRVWLRNIADRFFSPGTGPDVSHTVVHFTVSCRLYDGRKWKETGKKLLCMAQLCLVGWTRKGERGILPKLSEEVGQWCSRSGEIIEPMRNQSSTIANRNIAIGTENMVKVMMHTSSIFYFIHFHSINWKSADRPDKPWLNVKFQSIHEIQLDAGIPLTEQSVYDVGKFVQKLIHQLLINPRAFLWNTVHSCDNRSTLQDWAYHALLRALQSLSVWMAKTRSHKK